MIRNVLFDFHSKYCFNPLTLSHFIFMTMYADTYGICKNFTHPQSSILKNFGDGTAKGHDRVEISESDHQPLL